ncbi:MAG: hypothetical protein R3C68_02745 [Myxococcota bacterium]
MEPAEAVTQLASGPAKKVWDLLVDSAQLLAFLPTLVEGDALDANVRSGRLDFEFDLVNESDAAVEEEMRCPI